MITRICFQAAVNGNFEWMFWGLCPLVNNNLCTATRLSDAQGPLSSPTWKSPVFLLNELIAIISSWIDIYLHCAFCPMPRIQNTRIEFSIPEEDYLCVTRLNPAFFHSSERGKFSFPVHGNDTRTRPKKNEIPETQDKQRRCNRWKPRDWEISFASQLCLPRWSFRVVI